VRSRKTDFQLYGILRKTAEYLFLSDQEESRAQWVSDEREKDGNVSKL